VRDAMRHAPFVVRLVDGRAFTINHRDFCAVSPEGRGVTIYEGGRANHIDVRLVVSVDHVDPTADVESAAEGGG
ncbi:MAG: hypothetical protein ACHRXM_33860, partial [Isosphaerales bacterium]